MKVTVEVNENIIVTSVEEGGDPFDVVLMIGGQVVQVDGTDLAKAVERCQCAEDSKKGYIGKFRRREF